MEKVLSGISMMPKKRQVQVSCHHPGFSCFPLEWQSVSSHAVSWTTIGVSSHAVPWTAIGQAMQEASAAEAVVMVEQAMQEASTA